MVMVNGTALSVTWLSSFSHTLTVDGYLEQRERQCYRFCLYTESTSTLHISNAVPPRVLFLVKRWHAHLSEWSQLIANAQSIINAQKLWGMILSSETNTEVVHSPPHCPRQSTSLENGLCRKMLWSVWRRISITLFHHMKLTQNMSCFSASGSGTDNHSWRPRQSNSTPFNKDSFYSWHGRSHVEHKAFNFYDAYNDYICRLKDRSQANVLQVVQCLCRWQGQN